MTTRKLRWVKWLVLLVVLGGAGYAYYKYRKPAATEVKYRTATVTRGDITQNVSANGQLSPVINVAVGSQVSGNIQKLYADFNSRVTNGQLIVELDPATYQARVTQAEGELANARALAALAQVNSRRAEELMQNNLIARSDYDQTMAELAQREATVQMRQASLTNVLVDLARTKIYSPIDGTVISRNVDVGQTVQASFTAPTLFMIANDLAKMEIGAMVSEADIGGVEEGQEATFTVEAFPTRTFRGKVRQVRNQPTTNQNVVNYATIVDVRNDDLKLKPGMTANVLITVAKKQGVLRLPNAALRFRPPEVALVRTNLLRLASSNTNAPAAPGDTAATAPGGDGVPEFPGGFQPPPEVRQRILERYDKNGDGKLDESEREAMQEARRRRMAEGGGFGGGGFGGGGAQSGEGGPGGFGGGGPGGGGGGGRSRSSFASPVRTAYVIQTNAVAGTSVVELQPCQVRIGITDGSLSEVLEGLKEGDLIATGATLPAGSTNAPASNPFGGPFGGPRRP